MALFTSAGKAFQDFFLGTPKVEQKPKTLVLNNSAVKPKQDLTFTSTASTSSIPVSKPVSKSMVFPVGAGTPIAPAKAAIQTQIAKGKEDIAAREAQGFTAKRAFNEFIANQPTEGAITAQGIKQGPYAYSTGISQATEQGREATRIALEKKGIIYHPEATKAASEAIQSAVMGATGDLESIFGKNIVKIIGKDVMEKTLKEGGKDAVDSLIAKYASANPEIAFQHMVAPETKVSQLESGIQKNIEPVKLPGTADIRIPEPPLSNLSTDVALGIKQTGGVPPVSGLADSSLPKTYNDMLAQPETFYNIDRMAISDTAKQRMVETLNMPEAKKAIGKISGAKLTNKEVQQLASEGIETLQGVVPRAATAEDAAIALRTRQKVAASFENGDLNSDDLIREWTKSKSNATDIARQLQAMKIQATPKEMTAIDQMLANIYKAGHSVEDVIEASKGVDFKNIDQVTKWYRGFIQPTARDWLSLYRYSNMLSSPITHIVNSFTNLLQGGITAPAYKTTRGIVDAFKSAITGSERQFFTGEGVSHYKGYFKNISQASKNFLDVFTGKKAIENLDIRYIPLATEGTAKNVENVFSIPMRLLEGADQFFTTLSDGAAQSSLAYRAGKGGTVRPGEALKEAKYFLFRGETKAPEQGTVLDAVDSLAQYLNMARKSNNPIIHNIVDIALPFVKTPTEIIKQGIEFTPLGFTTLHGAANKTEQFAKAVMGSTIMGVSAAMLLGSNKITWAEPVDQNQKNAFRDAGLQPYSIKLGDKWISYSKLPPALAFNLAFVAALNDSKKSGSINDSQADTIVQTLGKVWGFWADQSYLKSMGALMNAAKGDQTALAQFTSGAVQQFIPLRALQGWITRILDPVQRKADPTGSMLEKQLQLIMTQIPGLSTKVPARLNKYGEPIVEKNVALNAISPLRVTTEDPAKAIKLQEAEAAKAAGAPYRKQQQEFETNASREAKGNLNHLNNLTDKESKIQFLDSLNDSQLERLISLKKEQVSNIDADIKEIKSYGVESGVRAKAIVDKLNTFTNKEDKINFLKELDAAKVITDPVFEQMVKLMNK